MGLFSKKVCNVCGGDAGRVFTKKLEDGVLCKECAGKLSPWFSERRSATVAQIEEQLAYREANKEKVAAFRVTRTFNGRYKVLLDEDAGVFCVVRGNNWRDSNPDILAFSDVTGCSYEVRETKRDVTPDGGPGGHGPGGPGYGGPQGGPGRDEFSHGGPGHGGPGHGPGEFGHGGQGHGGPGEFGHGGSHPGGRPGGPVYEYDYDFYLTINVNNPYFSEIEYQVNDNDIESQTGGEYQTCQTLCEDIKAALMQVREDSRAAAAPKQAVRCPNCGATTMPTANGCCEYCDGPL